MASLAQSARLDLTVCKISEHLELWSGQTLNSLFRKLKRFCRPTLRLLEGGHPMLIKCASIDSFENSQTSLGSSNITCPNRNCTFRVDNKPIMRRRLSRNTYVLLRLRNAPLLKITTC